ncbi:MAG: hypothetical protein R3D98_08780 [Candidatus Krumholzibacteriia bacterium]
MPTGGLCLLAAALVLNEVCYDPPGADAGAEFVELWHTGPDTLDLAGVGLEFANGAESPVRWQVRWTAPAGTRLASRTPFLIADHGWTGVPPQAEAASGCRTVRTPCGWCAMVSCSTSWAGATSPGPN